MREARTEDERGESSGARTLFLLALAAGVVALCVDAATKSLSLFELHSIFLAGASDLVGVHHRLQRDEHAPLFYFVLHAVRDLPPHWTRGLSVAARLLSLLPLLSLARHGGFSAPARAVLVAFSLLIPFQLRLGTALTAHGFAQAFGLWIVWAVFTPAPRAGPRFVGLVAAVALGLATHVFVGLVALGCAASRFFVDRPGWLGRGLVLAGCGVGALLFAPWLFVSDVWLVSSETIAPGGMARWPHSPGLHDAREAALAIPRLYVSRLQGLGDVPSFLVQAGAAVLAIAFVVLGARWLRSSPAGGGVRRGVFLAGILTALFTAVASFLVWGYFPELELFPHAWLPAFCFAVLVSDLPRAAGRATARFLIVVSVVAGLGFAFGGPREDLRAALAVARRVAGERDATFTAVLAQPAWYPNRTLFDAYAPDLPFREPQEVPQSARTVVVVARRNAPEVQPAQWVEILRERDFDERVNVDGTIWVHVYVKP